MNSHNDIQENTLVNKILCPILSRSKTVLLHTGIKIDTMHMSNMNKEQEVKNGDQNNISHPLFCQICSSNGLYVVRYFVAVMQKVT